MGGKSLSSQVGSRVSISALEAQGVGITTIDDFNNSPQQAVQAAFPVGNTGANALAYANSLGGERDLFVQLTSGVLGETVDMDSQFNRLQYSSSSLAQGLFRATWDGIDGNANVLAGNGLGGIDLTSAGNATAFEMTISADHVNQTATVRVYSGNANFSQSAPFPPPQRNWRTATSCGYA